MNVTRRRTLLATGAALGLAGCADGSSGGTPTETDGEGHDDVRHDVFQLGRSRAEPLWATAESATGFITLVETESDDLWMVENPDEIEGHRGARVLGMQSASPRPLPLRCRLHFDPPTRFERHPG